MIRLPRFEAFAVYRPTPSAICFAAALGLGLVPGMARAQVNIDQGKPAAEIFQSDCATCHKTARGLANGKNSLMLSGFLREHYTASREQAAALAAYVLGAGGSGPPPPASQKPGTEHAKVEEPKTDAKPEPKLEPKTDAKIEEPKGAAHPARQTSKPEATSAAPAPAAPAAPLVFETPVPASSPSQDNGATTTAAAPAGTQPGDNAPVPRDNIPD
jgi:mono/diheme cytochrome c family protein